MIIELKVVGGHTWKFDISDHYKGWVSSFLIEMTRKANISYLNDVTVKDRYAVAEKQLEANELGALGI